MYECGSSFSNHSEERRRRKTTTTALALAAKQDNKSFALFNLDPPMSACF
jgi:hypothetical protein